MCVPLYVTTCQKSSPETRRRRKQPKWLQNTLTFKFIIIMHTHTHMCCHTRNTFVSKIVSRSSTKQMEYKNIQIQCIIKHCANKDKRKECNLLYRNCLYILFIFTSGKRECVCLLLGAFFLLSLFSCAFFHFIIIRMNTSTAWIVQFLGKTVFRIE